jgi:hypothetical protein
MEPSFIGTANIVNKKRVSYPIAQNQLDDEDRFRFILKMTQRLKDIED